MEESAGSFVSVDTADDAMANFEFKPLEKEDYYLDETVKLYFRLPDAACWPSYLDVIRFAPLHETLKQQKKQTPSHELNLSYCRWNIENGDGQFSVIVKVEDIVATNEAFRNADEGIAYVVHYVTSPNNKVIAESTPFRIYPVLEESTMNLPEVFSDDGLIVISSGSDSEPELLDDEAAKDDSEEKAEKPSGDGEELTIVMTESELRKMEEENRASNEKLRSFIDQYKNDLMELTKCNETLKQKLYDEQYKVKILEKNHGKMSTELMEIRVAKLRVEAILKETIAERERKLRDEQNRTAKLEEEVSVLNAQAENLRCCIDAHHETKELLLAELDKLREKCTPVVKSLSDKSTSTPAMHEPLSRSAKDAPADSDEAKLGFADRKPLADQLADDISRLQKEKRKLCREVVRMKSEITNSEQSTDASDIGEPFRVSGQPTSDLEDRVQDLTKRLQAAKIEYISLYKENKRKEKALENICNWASLAKDGMSLEAPGPSQVPSLLSLTCNKYASCFDASFPKLLNNQAASSVANNQVQKELSPGFPSVKPRTAPGLEAVEDDFAQLGSDAKLPLPPRQKRKYDLLRKSSATAAAGAPSAAVSRAMQRGKMVVRGRHRANEPVRFPLKREMSSPGKEILDYSSSCLLPSASPPKPPQATRPRMIFLKKQTPKPSAPESNSLDEAADRDSTAPTSAAAFASPAVAAVAAASRATTAASACAAAPPAPPQIPRGTNTYSAAGLISDLETDASNTDEEPSVINPNICPLCLTSILDYEAHMREAHQKQPCPICGYVFDTNTPLYVMTYHIERHLEEVEGNVQTQ